MTTPLDLDGVLFKAHKRFNMVRAMDNLAGSFCDPIILHQCSWATSDFIPQWLKERITLDRMLELMVAKKEDRDPIGTDSEALAYMMPASMEAPMGHDWTEIYLYLATKVIEKEPNKVVPDDIRHGTINRDQERDLLRLKHWLYDTKLKHRAEKARLLKKEAKEAKAETEIEFVQCAFDMG